MILGYKRKNLRCLFANSGEFPLKILIELNELIERFGRFAVGAVGETNLALVNRNAEWNLHEGTGGEIVLHEAFDDAGDADADPGEINQQIHAGDIDDSPADSHRCTGVSCCSGLRASVWRM